MMMTVEEIVDEDGTREWCDEYGRRHRDGDLPAIVWVNGSKFWYQNDLLHRDGDLPAVVMSGGTKEWHQNGVLHRDGDLPAVMKSDGTKYWYQNDLLRRDGDLPVVVYFDGTMRWWQDGEMYREGGLPTGVNSDGSVLYGMRSSQKYTVEETVLSTYDGVQYSVPHWLVDGYSTAREESEGW